MIQEVILVNKHDQEIGTMEKMEAHVQGMLHRAFSVLIFNSKGQLLIHRRAYGKYHSEGLWTNTCCSHPLPGETIVAAANRRLMEEMGMETPLAPLFSFIYRAELENNLVEHELDHVLIGFTDDQPVVNPEEVSDYKWVSMHEIEEDIEQHEAQYTAWFKKIVLEYKSAFTNLLAL
ncbi:MAG: isopentenyl-diphosphate Delta-isomerase [Crocinitomicaceae bacterium]|nr:isopentenyl-diphosphate Delta-isomerase [Crocinitomicaceae bacterium]